MRGASLDMMQEARRGEELLVRAELLVACMSDARPADAATVPMRATLLDEVAVRRGVAPLTPYSDIKLSNDGDTK